MHGDDKPERSINGVELRLSALVGKPVRQHAFGNSTRPGDQNLPRLVEPSGGETQAAQSNQRITAPIGEPWVTSDDGFGTHRIRARRSSALNDVSVGGKVE